MAIHGNDRRSADSRRLRRERETIRAMIELYCRAHHGCQPATRRDRLCPDCRELLDYASKRLDRCPFAEDKPTCAKCPVHCYRPEMRQRVREVMRWAGPRMVLHHPVMAVRHLADGRRTPPPSRSRMGPRDRPSST